MNRTRGRPREKSYPEPNNLIRGDLIADFGKLGASEAMHIVHTCPLRMLHWTEKVPPHPSHKQFVETIYRFFEDWASGVGVLIGEKIRCGDIQFFRDLAKATEEISKKDREPNSLRRSLAIRYKLECELLAREPFTQAGLMRYYKAHGHRIDRRAASMRAATLR